MATLTGRNAKRGSRRPLHDVWTEECQRSFEGIKSRLVSAPVLAYANFSLPFILEVDASYSGLGAVLSQEPAGRIRPIAYASRGLKPTEYNITNWSYMKLEFGALKWSLTKKFRKYLLCILYTLCILITTPSAILTPLNWGPQTSYRRPSSLILITSSNTSLAKVMGTLMRCRGNTYLTLGCCITKPSSRMGDRRLSSYSSLNP